MRGARDEYAEMERLALVAVAERVMADPTATPELVECATAKLASPTLTPGAMGARLAALDVETLTALRAVIDPRRDPRLSAKIRSVVKSHRP